MALGISIRLKPNATLPHINVKTNVKTNIFFIIINPLCITLNSTPRFLSVQALRQSTPRASEESRKARGRPFSFYKQLTLTSPPHSSKIKSVNIQILSVLLASYVIGSVPFGYLIARIWNIDIRRQGSGNIGATNVFRTLGPLPGVLVFALDLLKGTLAIYLITLFTSRPEIIILAGLCAIIGHTFPIFLRFKGGRGAATGLGVLLGIAPEIFLAAAVVVILIIVITRYVSLASIITPILVMIAFILFKKPLPYTIVVGLVAGLIVFRHIPNIKRLLKRQENRIF